MQRNSRNERAVVTYARLIEKAHRCGLARIETMIVQLPSPENGQCAVMRAAVTMVQNGVTRVFHGTGDADPTNVSAQMRNCLIRLAETRSKARALRDAVNVGAVAAEELPDFDGEGHETAAEARPVKRDQPNADGPLLNTQEAAIKSLCKQKSLEVPEGLGNYTYGQAADLLRSLQERN